ncbi:MAG: AAA family ATPase [Bacteriovoracaceae bacterium]|jgi:predicted ATPase|nr:AAA family ATPase [Bacteriovoracaceae bacterium]
MYFDKRYIQSIQLNQSYTTKTGYPYNVPSIKYLEHLELDSNVTFLIGENGSGKSTLLEAIAVKLGFNPEGGSKNFNFNTSDSQKYASDVIDIQIGIRRPRDNYFLRAESFYNVASIGLKAVPAWRIPHSPSQSRC